MPRASCAAQPTAYQITGQRIHIEGPVVKFKPWANVIGMDSLFKVNEVYGTYVNPNCTNKYAPRREATEECKPGDFFGCLGQSWQMLNLADFSHTSASGQLMADGAVYDIFASQDAFELKPSLSNKVAMDLQDQVAPSGPADCDPVTTPVQTPSGEVEYRAPNAAPVTPARLRRRRRRSSKRQRLSPMSARAQSAKVERLPPEKRKPRTPAAFAASRSACLSPMRKERSLMTGKSVIARISMPGFGLRSKLSFV